MPYLLVSLIGENMAQYSEGAAGLAIRKVPMQRHRDESVLADFQLRGEEENQGG